jgi:hypothetical protein
MRYLLLIATILLPLTLRAAEPPPIPPLSKDDVRRILEAMEWREVNVIAVIQGVNEQKVAAPSLAFILALARRDGAYKDLRLDLFYDRDLGWFSYESSPKLFRIWTRDGYREIKANIGG